MTERASQKRAEQGGGTAGRGLSGPIVAAPAAGEGGAVAGVRGRPRAAPAARAERRRAILDAALAEFAAHGFAVTRLDDVARRAGVAKGTLYLYFSDKEALFRALVEENISSVLLDADTLVSRFPGTTRDLLERLMALMADRVLDAPAAALVRLMLGEGARFPELAAFYHREVVSHGLALIRQVARRGLDRGELSNDLAVRFPHLVVAPAILAVVWNGVFDAVDPLDARALLAAHRDLLLAGLGWRDA